MVVGAAGFEPTTSGAQGRRAPRLRYAPIPIRSCHLLARAALQVFLPEVDVDAAPRDTPFADAHGLREGAGFHLPVDRRDVERRTLFELVLVEQFVHDGRSTPNQLARDRLERARERVESLLERVALFHQLGVIAIDLVQALDLGAQRAECGDDSVKDVDDRVAVVSGAVALLGGGGLRRLRRRSGWRGSVCVRPYEARLSAMPAFFFSVRIACSTDP